MNGTELGDKLVEKYELGKRHGRIKEYHRLMGVFINIEKIIKKEDLSYSTREQVRDGVFARIFKAIDNDTNNNMF